MAGTEGNPFRGGGEAGGPCAGSEVEQLRRIFREVILPELKPVLRRMMREEMQNVLLGCTSPTLRIPSNQSQASINSCFQLHFSNELPEIIFTGNTVEPKGNAPLQIFITDSEKRIITCGPLSMIKIEILVLDGDFGDEEQGSWTEEEFNKHVLRERKDKRPLLKGNRFITLKDGVGNLCDISFTDNSKWTRTQKFRLGARALQVDVVEERIQEAISEAFYVNDQRGEYTMKHHTPSLEDEVWRLKHIRKDGPYHRKLVEHGIITVEDFLKYLHMDRGKLCGILFGKRMAKKTWETIVQHALKCNLGHESNSCIFPGQQVKLSSSVFQDFVDRLKHVAYGDQNEIVELNDLPSSLSRIPSAPPATCTPETNPSDLHHSSAQISHEAVYETDALADTWDPSVPPIEDSNLLEGQQQTYFTMEGCHMDGILDCNTAGCGTESCNNVFMAQHMSWNKPTTRTSHSKWVKLRFSVRLRASIRKSISARRSAKIRQNGWSGLLAALKFGRSIRRRVAATKRARLLNRMHSWSRELSPPPFIYSMWTPEEYSNF